VGWGTRRGRRVNKFLKGRPTEIVDDFRRGKQAVKGFLRACACVCVCVREREREREREAGCVDVDVCCCCKFVCSRSIGAENNNMSTWALTVSAWASSVRVLSMLSRVDQNPRGSRPTYKQLDYTFTHTGTSWRRFVARDVLCTPFSRDDFFNSAKTSLCFHSKVLLHSSSGIPVTKGNTGAEASKIALPQMYC
jgi:hypothetical protein